MGACRWAGPGGRAEPRGVAARCPPPSAAPARPRSPPPPAMPPARADYLAPWWAVWLHGLPHRGLRLQPVPAAFRPRDPDYQQVPTPTPPPTSSGGTPEGGTERSPPRVGVSLAGGAPPPFPSPSPRPFHPGASSDLTAAQSALLPRGRQRGRGPPPFAGPVGPGSAGAPTASPPHPLPGRVTPRLGAAGTPAVPRTRLQPPPASQGTERRDP